MLSLQRCDAGAHAEPSDVRVVRSRIAVAAGVPFMLVLNGPFQQTFWLSSEAWSDFFGGPSPVLSFAGELEYKDVFGKPHRIDWCWDTFAQANNNGQVADCFALKRAP
jgi:hypothetical protein